MARLMAVLKWLLPVRALEDGKAHNLQLGEATESGRGENV